MTLKKYRYVILFTVLSILCVSFIFGQSLKPSKVSNAESDRVIEVVKPIIDPNNQMTAKQTNFLVRKSAHLTEFAVLGICLAALSTAICDVSRRRMPFMAPFLVLATAVTDEYIQSFLDRTSKVGDILIDFSGALIGILAVTLFVCCRNHWRRKHESQQ